MNSTTSENGHLSGINYSLFENHTNVSDLDITGFKAVFPSSVIDYMLQILLAFLILVVNGLVMFALGTTPSLYTPTNLIIGGLSLSDFGMGLTRPLQALLEIGVLKHKTICLVSHSFTVTMSAVSMQHLTFVSIDRYIRIKQPFHYTNYVTKRRVSGIILMLWTGCSVLCFLPVMGLHRADFDGSECTSEAILEPWCFHFIMTANFVCSSIVLTGVYFKIFQIARRKKAKHVNRIVKRKYLSSAMRNLKAARLLGVLCVYFLLSWAPFCTLRYIAVFTGSTLRVPFIIERTALTFAVSNSLGNPLLYACGDRNVRAAIKNIVCNHITRRRMAEERRCESYM